ncbi:MAG TPA: hypothetical protein VIU61_01510 [Kofleriaceae bacterium]
MSVDAEQLVDLEVKLAYQDRAIRELDQLVRALVTRLEVVERELGELKQVAPAAPLHERPPHY